MAALRGLLAVTVRGDVMIDHGAATQRESPGLSRGSLVYYLLLVEFAVFDSAGEGGPLGGCEDQGGTGSVL